MRGLLWLSLSLSLLRTQTADVYRLDAVNTRISFNIQHFGVLWVSARFPDFSGDFVLDRDGAAGRIDVSVQTASVDCNDAHWNARLRSADWLDVQRYPQMTFHSNHVVFDGNNRALASGELTLHGVTRAVGLQINQLSCPDASGSDDSCSFVAHARIKRSDYGLAHGFWMGGDQVEIAISGVGVRGGPSPRSAADSAIPSDAAATMRLTGLIVLGMGNRQRSTR
jgi:polyisoprenoid-binding protein YceI